MLGILRGRGWNGMEIIMLNICGSNGRKCKRNVWLSESGGKNQKSVCWNDEIKLQLEERWLLGGRCWQPAMSRQKKEVWKRTEKRRERLKGVYIIAKRN